LENLYLNIVCTTIFPIAFQFYRCCLTMLGIHEMLGIIAIGRNEGERLRLCLLAAVREQRTTRPVTIVYVDSGSTDHSVELAASLGASVVNLDLSIPFTAARARNAGYKKLISIAPHTKYIQFLDGDCELQTGWIDDAIRFIESHDRAAIVGGRCRERYPEHSIYNALCDQEWNTPIGLAKSCGGNALILSTAFNQVGGFHEDMIAGEEPEMCVRLRAANWEIWRIEREMVLHDADIQYFSQWWKRSIRTGHAYAEGNWKHGGPPERFWAKEVRSNWIWGFAWFVPILWPLHLYLAWKIRRYRLSLGDPAIQASRYAFFVTLGKLPQMLGQLQFYVNLWLGRKSKLIEYKAAE